MEAHVCGSCKNCPAVYQKLEVRKEASLLINRGKAEVETDEDAA